MGLQFSCCSPGSGHNSQAKVGETGSQSCALAPAIQKMSSLKVAPAPTSTLSRSDSNLCAVASRYKGCKRFKVKYPGFGQGT